MKLRNRFQKLGMASALPLALTLSVATPALGQAAKSSLFAQADSVVAENPGKIVQASVWLNLHNKKELDQTVAKLYEPGSPTYHKWLKNGDLARFSPTAAEIETVKKQLADEGLTVVSTGKHNMYVTVRGPVSTMQRAFQTEIKSLAIKGKTVSATTTKPMLRGASTGMVAAVTGLTQHELHPDSVRPVDPETRKPFPARPLTASPKGVFYSAGCFRGIQSVALKTPGSPLPIANYAGKRYGADIQNTTPGTISSCGYDARELTTAYGMRTLFERGLDGTGQTIVIVDAYGSPTIKTDANTFSQINGLPALTDSNFQIIYPLGPPKPTSPGNAAGWAEETSLDVEWAHAFAPGANILLIASPSNENGDLYTSVFYAVANGLGSVISNSYSGFEIEDLLFYPEELIISNSISELGASLGISVHFSSGDDGDNEAAIGVKTVSDLGDSPYATSVGGTSLSLMSTNAINFQTGWGNNATQLARADKSPVNPPVSFGFQGGAGGGESEAFAKPSWQSHLPGAGRQQPDVSLVADPYTGAEVIFTMGGDQYIGAFGGTSLSCPAFSAIWAVANQRAGQLYGEGAWLGQAAPTVARLAGTKAIRDVTAYSSPANVTGFILDANGATLYSPDQLAAPLNGTTKYLSAFYNADSGAWYDLTFGTDSSLVVTEGWDNVTGYGTPHGLDFVYAAAR